MTVEVLLVILSFLTLLAVAAFAYMSARPPQSNYNRRKLDSEKKERNNK